MVSNLEPRQVLGVGAETAYIQSHLLDKNGRVRDLDVVSRELDGTIVQFAYLDYEIGRHLQRPMTRGYPPKIFFSYRRESVAHIKWCEDLAGELQRAGYEVELDAIALPEENPSKEALAQYVGRLATADVALVVVTPGYVGTEREMRRWLFEEWTRIERLRIVGLLEIVGVVREGTYRNTMASFNPALDALIDLTGRDQADRRPVLDFFGTYRGPRIAPADRLLLAQNANSCIEACDQKNQATAALHLSHIARFEETEEFRVANVVYHAAFRSAGQAIQLAEEARAKPLAFSALAALAQGMWSADLDFSAFRAMAEIAESPSWWRGFFHLIMGETLMKRGFARSALNHLSWCVTVRLDGSLQQESALGAEFLDQAREDMSIAQRVIAQGGGTISAAVEPRPRRSDIRCDICGSHYSAAGWACALCGTLHAAGVKHCAMCGHDVISMRKLWFCPVCRTSFKNVHGHRIQSMLLSRRPGERFSVLWPYAKPVQNPFAGA